MARPENLPDFENPPLTEVVLGVQFDPPPFYTRAEAKEIWKLFSAEYPKAEEMSARSFYREIFDDVNVQDGTSSSPNENRWCLTAGDKNSVIQFQPDCFIVNWVANLSKAPYPRYEEVAKIFEHSLKRLDTHYKKELGCSLKIKQAELSYYNRIAVDDFHRVGDWIKFLQFEDVEHEGFEARWSQDCKNENDKPFARLHHHLFKEYIQNGLQQGIGLSFVYRGQPSGKDISSAMQFLAEGRTIIVKNFTDITTESAHEKWRRKR